MQNQLKLTFASTFRKECPIRPASSYRVPLLAIAVLLAGLAFDSAAQAAKPKPVSVFPAPGTPVASDSTTFSFRGLKPGQLGPVKVVGSRSGFHGGKRLAHSDGKGVSFVPHRRFKPGETVRVFTKRRIKLTRNGDFTVQIGRFYGPDRKSSVPEIPNQYPRLHSRPDLRPTKLDVLARNESTYPGKIFFAPKQTGLTIADSYGRTTWFQATGHGGNGEEVQNFGPQRYEGRQVLTYWKGSSSSDGKSQIGYFTILNRSYGKIARFRVGNGYKPDAHEFTITPRNTALVLAYRAVRWDTSKFGGLRNGKLFDNVVQEIDIKTGAVLFEWHSIGNVGLEATVSKPEPDGSAWDYFHVNSVVNDGDSVLVSARKVNTLYRIDRATGRVRWRLRGDGMKGKTNNFAMKPGARFGFQHDARRLPNGDISLFDNGSAKRLSTVRAQSSGMILRIEGRKGKRPVVTLVKRYPHRPEPIVAGSQGSAQVLPGGNMFVGWGSRSQITEFTPDGNVAFDATFADAPVNSYRARKEQWTGFPTDRPAIASRRTKKDAVVWASWNGADRVHTWQVFTGPNAKSLKPVKSALWTGLETKIPFRQLGSWVMVRAIDREGKLLRRSAVARAGTRAN
ncbi:MAG: arylsulfotransferase family protein [Solirubrobacterales bacterium]